ncbi:MAG: hypothetical protein N2450_07180 [bacterium]|nr:hypothetical protein [bacterium]
MGLFDTLRTTSQHSQDFTPEDLALLEKLADKIVKRRMSVPAIMFFESVKPMNFVGAQVMIFLQPFVTAFFTLPEYDRLRELLERRETLYKFVEILEKKEDDFLSIEKEMKKQRKLEKEKQKSKKSSKKWWKWWTKKDDNQDS